MLTGWLGVGTALSEAIATENGLTELRHMTRTWPFFDDFLAKVEMVCAKTDLEIARAYVERLGGDMTLLAQLEAEFQRTVDSVLKIRETSHLIADVPVLSAAIALRNPYVDPLSLLQIALLERKRRAESSGEDHAAIDDVLATTLSGIAQGLRNTG
jgi:phosphoenolpyruvate carboxylase